MPLSLPTPPVHPDIKRELKHCLLSLPARSFEFFASELLLYAGLEAVSVTRYSGDGGIDAQGKLLAGPFRLSVGVQVKRYRHNVQRPDIERFIGALSGRFADGLFITTADYTPKALHKAATSIPRVLTLNGEHIVSLLLEKRLGVKPSPIHPQKFIVDNDYFAHFESMRNLLYHRDISSTDTQGIAGTDSREGPVDLSPEEDVISLNALSYALRVDPTRVRVWVDEGHLIPDATTISGGRVFAYFRRDRIEQIRRQLRLQPLPASSEEWKQAFLDFMKSRVLSKSYKPVLLKAFFTLVDREGAVKMEDLVKAFRALYLQAKESGQPLEHQRSIMTSPETASDTAVKRLIITQPLERFLIQNFMEYDRHEDILRIAPQIWHELRYYEVQDILKSTDEQLRYYLARENQRSHTGGENAS